jgi:uncharacterized Zn finger protein (UPF0148 family)
MSDFDKEAEREKLREKYEADQQDREATERMSDLLLKGATMTNAHCGTCGDPIFRYEDREFCPTCQEPVGEAADAETGDETEGVEQAPEAGAAGRSETTPDSAGQRRETNPETAPARDGNGAGIDAPGADSEPTPAPARPGTDAPDTSGGDPEPPQRAPQTPQNAGTGDVADARRSVARTLARLAAQADASEDLERTTAYLAAVEDAADALAAINETDR